MQWRNAIDDVITKTVNAAISRRVKELTRENTGSDRALSPAREMVKQADGLPSSLPPPPKGVFTTPESKASSLLATAKALQSRTEFSAASILFQKAYQLSASTTGDRTLRTKDPALGFRCLLCYAQCYAAWLKVALTVAVRDRTTRQGQCDGMSDSRFRRTTLGCCHNGRYLEARKYCGGIVRKRTGGTCTRV